MKKLILLIIFLGILLGGVFFFWRGGNEQSVEEAKQQVMETFQKERMSLAVFNQERWDREQKFLLDEKHIFGPALFDIGERFALFAEKIPEGIRIKIVDEAGREESLTEVEGEFRELDMQRNFRLQSDGVVIPEKNNLYFFDFFTRKKRYLGNIKIADIQFISVGYGDRFLAKTENGWILFENKKEIPLHYETRTATFEDGDMWEFRGNQIFVNDEMRFELAGDLKPFYEFWFNQNTLFLKGDDEVWKVGF